MIFLGLINSRLELSNVNLFLSKDIKKGLLFAFPGRYHISIFVSLVHYASYLLLVLSSCFINASKGRLRFKRLLHLFPLLLDLGDLLVDLLLLIKEFIVEFFLLFVFPYSGVVLMFFDKDNSISLEMLKEALNLIVDMLLRLWQNSLFLLFLFVMFGLSIFSIFLTLIIFASLGWFTLRSLSLYFFLVLLSDSFSLFLE